MFQISTKMSALKQLLHWFGNISLQFCIPVKKNQQDSKDETIVICFSRIPLLTCPEFCSYCEARSWKKLFVFQEFCLQERKNSYRKSSWLQLITVWSEPIWIKVKKSWLLLPQHQSTYARGPESVSIEIPPFRPHFIKFSKTVFY